jgi:N-acetyl-beta-hexosaminidase
MEKVLLERVALETGGFKMGKDNIFTDKQWKRSKARYNLAKKYGYSDKFALNIALSQSVIRRRK